MSKYRNWVFTINNYTLNDIESIEKCPFNYLIYGKELGEQDTPHLQGYIRFKNGRNLKTMKNINERAHWEVAKGDFNSNFDYCTKDGDFYEFGTRPKGKGARSDIDIVYESFNHGESIPDLINQHHLGYQALRLREKLESYKKQDPLIPKRIYWFYGEPGSGKTSSAINLAVKNNMDFWISGKNLEWFDGYCGQKIAIFDDFRGDFCTLHYLLRLLDQYPLKVPIKGGFTDWKPEHVIITCPILPERVYSTNENLNQLLRRIDIIKLFKVKTQDSEVQGNTKPGLLDGSDSVGLSPAEPNATRSIKRSPHKRDFNEEFDIVISKKQKKE